MNAVNGNIELISEIGVHLISSMGDDDSVVHAARVSVVGARAETEGGERKGLLAFLMKNKHASPFEHVTATFMIECPIFVVREVHRHRTFSYNETSGRYSVLQPKFYSPHYGRPLVQEGKPGAYTFVKGTEKQHDLVADVLEGAYQFAWDAYQYQLSNGIAKEVARDCLPVGIYTSFYMTGNLRNFLNFLVLRESSDALYEIRQVAHKIHHALRTVAPECVRLWEELNCPQL
jgi:thymidylate synthase (FAD)